MLNLFLDFHVFICFYYMTIIFALMVRLSIVPLTSSVNVTRLMSVIQALEGLSFVCSTSSISVLRLIYLSKDSGIDRLFTCSFDFLCQCTQANIFMQGFRH